MSTWDPDKPPKLVEELTVTQRPMRYLKVADVQLVSQSRLEGLLAGAHHAELESEIDRVTGHMILRLNAHMLTEPAGDEVTESQTEAFRFTSPNRPWWIPRFLWRRIGWTERTVYRTVSLTARPYWKYPEATYIVELGQGRRGVFVETFTVDGSH